jgi:hypothetical protein
MRIVNPRSFIIAFAFAAACGGKSTPAGGGGGGGTGPEEPAMGPLTAGQWETMDHEARAKFMGKVVLPTMEAEFKKFDPTRFAEVNCKTCHGKSAEDHTFKMPNPDLPVLTGEMFQNPPEDDKAIMEFMMQTVKPKMAELLGMPEKTETTEGFGCDNCHTFN